MSQLPRSPFLGNAEHFADDFGDCRLALTRFRQRIRRRLKGADTGIERRHLIQRRLVFVPIVQQIRHGFKRAHRAAFESPDDFLDNRRLSVSDNAGEDEGKEPKDGVESVFQEFIGHHFVAVAEAASQLVFPQPSFDVHHGPVDADAMEEFDGEFDDFETRHGVYEQRLRDIVRASDGNEPFRLHLVRFQTPTQVTTFYPMNRDVCQKIV